VTLSYSPATLRRGRGNHHRRPPSQAPVINGPMSQPAFQGMTGIGQ
jgi:hypothetical protein